jgi:hypothetical protein
LAALLLASCAVPPPPGPLSLTQGTGLARLSAGPGPGCISTGGAVHIGRGRFVTAAHLVDGTQPRLHGCGGGVSSPWLFFDGGLHQAEVLRAGQADFIADAGLFYVGGRDVALLRLSPPAPAALPPALPPCPNFPRPGEAARLLTPGRQQLTRIAGLMLEDDPLYGGYAELALRLEPGESGGAVLDPGRHCLLGLVSHRTEGPAADRTRVVPASVLRAFLGE